MKLNKGYQIARLLTKSKVSDEQIEKELSSMTALEWDRICNILDNFLKAHDMPLDQGWALMINDIHNISDVYKVSEATLLSAYLPWIGMKKNGSDENCEKLNDKEIEDKHLTTSQFERVLQEQKNGFLIHMNNEEAEDKFMHRNIELVDLSFDEVQTVKNNQLLAFTTNDSNASMFIDKKEIHDIEKAEDVDDLFSVSVKKAFNLYLSPEADHVDSKRNMVTVGFM